eukprot:10074102-Karenia_brevis.AAC.1
MHPQHVFFKLDAHNVYNSQWRSTSVNQAAQDVPALAGLSLLCYCRGEGDGLAPALLAFGMKQPAQAMLDQLQQLSAEECNGEPTLVLFYLDDVVVAVPE